MTKMAPMAIYGKTFKNLFLQYQWADCHETWYVALRMRAQHNFFKLLPLVDLDIFYAKAKFGHLGFYMGRNENESYLFFIAHLSKIGSK